VEVDGDSEKDHDYEHIPVLVEEVLAGLACRQGGIYVDCTVGQGGMTRKILESIGPTGRVLGIDRDETALTMTRRRLTNFAPQLKLIHGNFGDIQAHVRAAGLLRVDGIVFDLGVSSVQLNDARRGFSFAADGPLDMRMDRSTGRTAAELVAQLSESELSNLIFQYGEERFARRIARALVQVRIDRPLQTTNDLVSAIRSAVPASYRHGRIHCATRTFQALRIAVNRELEVLDSAFRAAAEMLMPGGRLCIISFHSLEDRIAKQTIRDLSQGAEPLLMRMTKKPVTASETELAANPRARSAKLRIAERVSQRRCA